jgi:uncharacterized integral membrane protein (TIGR00698 family)
MPDAASEPAVPSLPERLGRWAIPAGGVAAAIPGVPPWAALIAGVTAALLLGNPYAARTRRLARLLLPAAVVGLGAAMDLRAVARAGLQGAGSAAATIAATLCAGALLARIMRLRSRATTLVTVGTAICGGSAIAAAAPVIGAEDDEVSLALGTVFVLNGVALFVFPVVGRWAGLDERAFGMWAALGIHDTSSVVGAALQVGTRALEVATTVKLARALWIVPLTLALGLIVHRGGARNAPRPWFILGFVAAAALTTAVPALRPAGRLVAAVARQALVVTLFLIGAGMSREALRAVGPRSLLHGTALWLMVAGGTLAAVRAGLL